MKKQIKQIKAALEALETTRAHICDARKIADGFPQYYYVAADRGPSLMVTDGEENPIPAFVDSSMIAANRLPVVLSGKMAELADGRKFGLVLETEARAAKIADELNEGGAGKPSLTFLNYRAHGVDVELRDRLRFCERAIEDIKAVIAKGEK